MRWLFYPHKATRRFLNCQQNHFHGRLDLGCGSRAWESMGWSKSLSFCPQYSTSTFVNGTESPNRSMMNGNKHDDNNHNNITKVDLEVTSRETIKPASPYPHHLKNLKLSIIDQIFFDCYTPLTLFFTNNNKTSVTNIVKNLKKTLSEILTRFYPLAGELKQNMQIECNNKGVCFTEARVNQCLKEFLRDPDDENVRKLTPKTPRTGESSIENYLIGVQVNIFDCGGIGLSTSITHKIFDGHTYFLFMKAWAAAASGSPETISPSFVASEVFPNNPSSEFSWPSKLTNTESVTTKRFLFDSIAMASLKAQPVACTSSSSVPTRMEATTAVIWKAAAKTASTIRPFNPQSPHALLSYVNLRRRALPPLPYESIGNIISTSTAICFPESQPDLPTLMGEIRESIARINSDYIESLKGQKGHEAVNGILRSANDLMDVTKEGDNCVFLTSLVNNGIYDIDFGWGKPIWFYDMNAGFSRIVALNDTLKGGGVEATVTLSTKEMEIFERDPELLSYATVNPSPLQFLDD